MLDSLPGFAVENKNLSKICQTFCFLAQKVHKAFQNLPKVLNFRVNQLNSRSTVVRIGTKPDWYQTGDTLKKPTQMRKYGLLKSLNWKTPKLKKMIVNGNREFQCPFWSVIYLAPNFHSMQFSASKIEFQFQ